MDRLTAGHWCVPLERRELTSVTCELTSVTCELTSVTCELTSATCELTSAMRELTSATRELTSERRGVTIATGDVTSERDVVTATGRETPHGQRAVSDARAYVAREPCVVSIARTDGMTRRWLLTAR